MTLSAVALSGDTITESLLRQIRNELSLGSRILSGLTPSTPYGFAVDIASGSALVDGCTIESNATEQVTLSASQTRYVCLKVTLSSGNVSNVEVSSETAIPTDTTTAKYLLLAKAVTDALGDVTITDLRRIAVNPELIALPDFIYGEDTAWLRHSAGEWRYNANTATEYAGFLVPDLSAYSAASLPWRWVFLTAKAAATSGSPKALPQIYSNSSLVRAFTEHTFSGSTPASWRIPLVQLAGVEGGVVRVAYSAASSATQSCNWRAIMTNDPFLLASPTYTESDYA